MGLGTPVLVHFGRVGAAASAPTTLPAGSGVGKEVGRHPRARQASSLRYTPLTELHIAQLVHCSFPARQWVSSCDGQENTPYKGDGGGSDGLHRCGHLEKGISFDAKGVQLGDDQDCQLSSSVCCGNSVVSMPCLRTFLQTWRAESNQSIGTAIKGDVNSQCG